MSSNRLPSDDERAAWARIAAKVRELLALLDYVLRDEPDEPDEPWHAQSRLERSLSAIIVDYPLMAGDVCRSNETCQYFQERWPKSFLANLMEHLWRDEPEDSSTLLAGYIGDAREADVLALVGTAPRFGILDESLALRAEFVEGMERAVEGRRKAIERRLSLAAERTIAIVK